MQRWEAWKMSFKVPEFISKELNKLPNKDKEKFISEYKRWEQDKFTKMFTKWIEDKHNRLLKADENESDCISEFQFSYKLIANRSKRNILSEILNKLDWRV